MRKIVEKSPDEGSVLSRRKKRKSTVDQMGKTMSAGRTSDGMNNSMMEGLSVSAIPSNMNDSVPKITN
jgi:hypothetical protein